MISELVANSVEHGRGTIQLSVEHRIHAIHGSVTDDDDGFAYTPPDFSSQALRGRGLAIVDASVSRWGIRHGSTQVWFDITLTASPPIAPLSGVVDASASPPSPGAVRALLQLDGEPPPPEPFKAMLPVSMRRIGRRSGGGLERAAGALRRSRCSDGAPNVRLRAARPGDT